MPQSRLPEDQNTADVTTWRYVGHLLPTEPADGNPLIVDVLERTASPSDKLVRSETQYNGDGTFYSMQGETVYWCYQRPMPAEYLTEEEASAGLDVSGYGHKWRKSKAAYKSLLQANELCAADYWLAVRLHFLELGGCYLSERTERGAEQPMTSLEMRMATQSAAIQASRQSWAPPQKVRQG